MKKRESQERKNKKNNNTLKLLSDIFPFYGENFKDFMNNKEKFETFKKIEEEKKQYEIEQFEEWKKINLRLYLSTK